VRALRTSGPESVAHHAPEGGSSAVSRRVEPGDENLHARTHDALHQEFLPDPRCAPFTAVMGKLGFVQVSDERAGYAEAMPNRLSPRSGSETEP
jgi:hypothetical protein